MNTVIQTDFDLMQYRRCVGDSEADQLYYQATSDNEACKQIDPPKWQDSLTCHLACEGTMCNTDINPPANTLYRPHQ